MKKVLSLLFVPVLAAGISFAQSDQKATSTDTKKPSAADQAAAQQPDAAAAGQDDATSPRTEPQRAQKDHDYGWIGLLGLVGLAGLRRRRDHADIDRDRVTTMSSDRENLRRVG
jgi:MYXO-CTERM domain-containing protein